MSRILHLAAKTSMADALQLTKPDLVCATLREAIISGVFEPGEHIGQQELAEQLNVSATPVREALRKLEALSILTYEPHRGARVTRSDARTAEEIYRVRGLLEGLAVEKAASSIGERELEELEQLAADTMALVPQGKVDAEGLIGFRKANYEFHKALCNASGMAVVPEIVENLWARVPVPTELFIVIGTRARSAAEEHIQIMEAVRNRDGSRARCMMEVHIDNARIAYVAYLDRTDGYRTGYETAG
jgi:DNA-binding GntR family transcriptional regulator